MGRTASAWPAKANVSRRSGALVLIACVAAGDYSKPVLKKAKLKNGTSSVTLDSLSEPLAGYLPLLSIADAIYVAPEMPFPTAGKPETSSLDSVYDAATPGKKWQTFTIADREGSSTFSVTLPFFSSYPLRTKASKPLTSKSADVPQSLGEITSGTNPRPPASSPPRQLLRSMSLAEFPSGKPPRNSAHNRIPEFLRPPSVPPAVRALAPPPSDAC